MAKMRISPELKKLIEKYRCVKDTDTLMFYIFSKSSLDRVLY